MNANVLRAAPSAANLRWLWLSLAVIAVDQLTKHWILATFRPGEDLPLTPFASLVLAFNTGAAFSFLAGEDGWQRWLFAAIAVAACAAMVWLMHRGGNALFSAGLALIIARPTVEAAALRLSENPVQATFVGIATQVLLVPTLILAAIVLAISIIGIPLLLLLPFVVLILLMLALVGFAGAATAVGQWLRGRTGMPSAGGLVDVALGVLVILLPLLVGRVIGLAGWPVNPVAFLLVALGLAVEFLAWTSGFGAVLTNAFSRWQARRASRLSPPPPVTP